MSEILKDKSVASEAPRSALHDLAKSIEKQDSDLSKRLIKISKAKATAREQQEALRTELSSDDMDIISEVSKSSEASPDVKAFAQEVSAGSNEEEHDKNIEVALKKGGIAAAAGAAVAASVSNFDGVKNASGLNLIEKITAAFSKTGDIWDSFLNKIEKWFSHAFPSLAKLFEFQPDEGSGGKLPTKKTVEEAKEKIKQTEEKVPESSKEALKEAEYSFMARHLIRRNNRKVFKSFWGAIGAGVAAGTWGNDERKAEDEAVGLASRILSYDVVRNKTFNELQKFNDYPEKLGLSGGAKELSATSLMLKALSANADWMDENLRTINPNWKNMPLSESLRSLYKGIGYEKLDRVQQAIANIDMSKPEELITHLTATIFRKNPTTGNFDGVVDESMGTLRDR